MKDWVRSRADERAVDAGCVFDLAAADRVRLFFAKYLRHSKGGFAGKPFELLDWQWREFIGPLFGWLKADGTRRYRRFDVWVSKKNGKSTIGAGLQIYMMMGDHEAGAHCYGAAADREQAGIIFEECAAMVDQSRPLEGRLSVNRTIKRITFEARHSFYQVLSREARKTGHGLNAHFALIDELHVVNREMHDTLRYAGAARRQPLFGSISTAGNDKTSLGYERYCYAKQVLDGTIEDPDFLPVVYEADNPDQWTDPQQWQKANPSLGVTITLDSFKADFREAKQSSPASQANFKQLRLNLWQDAISAWIPIEEWDACQGDITPELLEGKPCWAGLDLASKLDVCAFVLLFQLEPGSYAILARFWAPEEADSRRQQKNLDLLKPWMQAGFITATEGKTTDYDVIEQQILDDWEKYSIRTIGFDGWNATQVCNHLLAAGVKMVECPQSPRFYNEPMKELEKLVISRKIIHDGNLVMRWMAKNVSVKKDPSGNERPDRDASSDKIDGVCATIMALAQATVADDNGGESDYSEITYL